MTNPDPTPTAPAIEMQSATISSLAYPDRAVLEDVNWTVNAGEFWVVGAMHGSGKSDLISTAGGLLPPMSGSYYFFGHEMPIFDEHKLAERLRLGMVFESGQLLQNLTIKENVALPLRYHRPNADEHEVRHMLELTGLKSLASSAPDGISRSWQKRTGLARALMLRPEVLLLDNPLAGLDLRHLRWWIHFLKELSTGHECAGGRPMTIVVTTDDLRHWRQMDAHFAMLQDKHFIPLGRQKDLAAHSQPLVRELLAQPIA